MPTWGVIAFAAGFVAIAAFIFIASGRERRRWRARPAILRALATRRGCQFVENPGKPSDLVPIRQLDRKDNLEQLELPAAVRGRTLDGEFTLFDVFTERKSGIGTNASDQMTYETFITLSSGDQKWPHFEFAALSHSAPDSMEGKLLAMAGNLADGLMEERGLRHVPIPERPGFQLFIGDGVDPGRLRDALVGLFEQRGKWWVGALDDALTLQKRDARSVNHGMLIPKEDLDRFIDEAEEIERSLNRAIRP